MKSKKNSNNTNKTKRQNILTKIVKNSIKMDKLKINDERYKNTSICPPYLDAILSPEQVYGGKIPGMADQTVALHRKITVNTTASALGAFSVFGQLTTLFDTANPSTSLFINNNALYDGLSSATSPIGIATPFNIPVNTVGTYRLVSGSVVVQPQMSNLNLQGTIHSALIKLDGVVPLALGSTSASAALTVATIQNSTTYAEVNAQSGAGARVIWLPNDIHLLQFKAINYNWQSYEQTMNEFIPCFVGVGFPAGAPIRVDLYYNFEVTPYASSSGASILQGMESICPHTVNPGNVWRQVLTQYANMISSPYFGHSHRLNIVSQPTNKRSTLYEPEDEDFLISKYQKMMN